MKFRLFQLFCTTFTALSLHAAPSLLINFSNAGDNDVNTENAATIGSDTFANILTNQTNGSGTTTNISIDGVSGSVMYSDYYQQQQKNRLGQPYATLIGAGEIASSGKSVEISLDLKDWMKANAFETYQVTIYYAGRSSGSEALMTDESPDVFLNDSIEDTVFVSGRDSGYWKGNGQTHAFTNSDLTISMNYLGEGQEAGIAALRIDGVVQPKGLWLFDDANHPGKASIGEDLHIIGKTPVHEATVSDGQPNPMLLQGVITTQKGEGNHLKATHNIGPNGNGDHTNEYTLVYDVMIPDTAEEWRALYQTNLKNSDDAELFIRSSGNTLGRSSINYSGKGLSANRWYRIAISTDLKNEIQDEEENIIQPAGFFRTYLDGSLLYTHDKPGLDGDYSLDPTSLLLFADDDGENYPLKVGMIAIYGQALTSGQIASLGGPGMAMLPNPDNHWPAMQIVDAGDKQAETGTSLSYQFSSSDQDHDLIQIQVDWGDGRVSDWSGFTTPESPVSFQHLWKMADSYTIKARARDIYGAVSPWEEIQTIEISGPPVVTFSTPPYLQNMSTSGMVVMAEIEEEIQLSLEYGENFENSVVCESVASDGGTWFVRAILSGLDEDTEYTYRFRAEDGSEIIPSPEGSLINQPHGTFRTATTEHRDFTFGSIGDVQRPSNGGVWDADPLEPAKSMLAHMAAEGVSFGLGTGDQAENGDSYHSTKLSFLERMATKLGVHVPFYISWGNHDVRDANTPLRLAADMPSRYRTDSYGPHGPGTGSFAFGYAGVHFVCIDYFSIFDGINPVWIDRPENELANGYIESLLASEEAQNARYLVVACHVPPFGEVWRDGDAHLRRHLVPLLEKYNVSLVLSGHMHGYERGFLNGITYITSGGGSYLDIGVSIVRDWPHIIMGGHSQVPGYYAVQSSHGVLGEPEPIVNGMFHHYLKIDVNDERMRVEAIGFNADGSHIGVIDSTQVLRDTKKDSDGDGLPDAWEIAHGLDPQDATGDNGADGDPDGDGLTNREEYLSGTDPNSARIAYELSKNDTEPSTWSLKWNTASNREYRILLSPDSENWFPLQDENEEDVIVIGTGKVLEYTFNKPEGEEAYIQLEVAR